MTSQISEAQDEETIRQAFDEFDVEGNGKIPGAYCGCSWRSAMPAHVSSSAFATCHRKQQILEIRRNRHYNADSGLTV